MRQNLKVYGQTFLHSDGTDIKCSCGSYSPGMVHSECLTETAGKHLNELTTADFDPEYQKTIETFWDCPCGTSHKTVIHPPTIDKITTETTINK